MKGNIYVFINESMPGLVKIGRTCDDVEVRKASLSSHSGVPSAFESVYHQQTSDCELVESLIHRLLEKYRWNSKREFFKVSPSDAELVVKQVIDLVDTAASFGKNRRAITNGANHGPGKQTPPARTTLSQQQNTVQPVTESYAKKIQTYLQQYDPAVRVEADNGRLVWIYEEKVITQKELAKRLRRYGLTIDY